MGFTTDHFLISMASCRFVRTDKAVFKVMPKLSPVLPQPMLLLSPSYITYVSHLCTTPLTASSPLVLLKTF